MIPSPTARVRAMSNQEWWMAYSLPLLTYIAKHPGCTMTDITVAARKAGITRNHVPDAVAFLELSGKIHQDAAGWFPGARSRGT